MRKTFLVIGAVIGLAAGIASLSHAETVEQVEAIEVVIAKDFVDSRSDINRSEALLIERIAFAVGYEPSVKVEYVEIELPAGESTKLANVSSIQLQALNGYRQVHEVGWRFQLTDHI